MLRAHDLHLNQQVIQDGFTGRLQITECVGGNIAALIDGQWLTPALHCGLLPGVGRAVALREGRLQEAVIRREDAPRVQAWAFLNSLRGWLPATLSAPAAPESSAERLVVSRGSRG